MNARDELLSAISRARLYFAECRGRDLANVPPWSLARIAMIGQELDRIAMIAEDTATAAYEKRPTDDTFAIRTGPTSQVGCTVTNPESGVVDGGVYLYIVAEHPPWPEKRPDNLALSVALTDETCEELESALREARIMNKKPVSEVSH